MNTLNRLVIFLLILTFGILYFTTITSLSGSGEIISSLKEKLDSLEKKKIELSIELSQKNSLSKVEAKAKKQGLIPETKIIYLAKKPSSLVVSKR
jgi:cell division protein FtsL